MKTLLGNTSFRLKDFLRVSDDWQTSTESGVNISVQKEWDILNPLKIDHIIYRHSGGSNGRIIARYERTFAESSRHVITLHDHKLNTLSECIVNETCRDLFIYVSSSDELRVVTSSGRLFIFQGDTIISNVPILSPDLEPQIESQEDQEQTKPQRNREIIDVSFWETGFVYIDKDGNIIQYTLDNSIIQIIDQPTADYSQNDQKAEDKYIQNVERENNSRTKVISTKMKSIGIPICFEAIPPEFSGLSNGSPYIFLAGSTNNLYIVSENNFFTVELPSSIISLSFSPSFKFVAIIVDPMILLIMPVTLDLLLLRLEIDEGDVFEQLSWAGDDLPVISFDEMAILILQSSETIKIPTKSKSLIIKQSDSALILSDNALYRVSIISDNLARCFGVTQKGEEETAALNLIRSFCSYSHDQVLRMKAEKKLEEAIKDCIEAAQQIECDSLKIPDTQTVLMMAACFGRSYLLAKIETEKEKEEDEFNRNDTEITEEFMKVAKWIRLANMFKNQLNICVSPKSLRENTSPDDAILRICNRGLFSPAFEVADEFGGDKSSVVTRWCCKIIEKVKNDSLCYKILINMKKSLSQNEIKTQQQQQQQSIISALSKMRKKDDDFGQNADSETDEVRSTCSLFDTASIASACLIRGRINLASNIANNELNSSLVIPFFAASGLWKEALLAASNTWDSNILIDVLKKAVKLTSQSVISRAIETNYFAYSTTMKISLIWKKRMIEESNLSRQKMMEIRRMKRSRSVGKADIEICSNLIEAEHFAQSIKHIVKNPPKDKKVLDSYVKNKLRLMNFEIISTEKNGDKNESKYNSSKVVFNTDDEIKKICIDYPNTQWCSNQSEIMNLELKLINLHSKLVKNLEFENTNSSKSSSFDKIKSLKISDLSVNSLIRAAVDSNCFVRLIELSKSENFDDLNPKIASSIAASYLAKSGRFDEFKKLFSRSDSPFSSLYKLATTIAVHHFGKEKAVEFVNLLPDGKEKQMLMQLAGAASQVNSDQENPLYAVQFDVYGTNLISVDFFKGSIIGR